MISGSLAAAGYNVLLVGLKQKRSVPLAHKNFEQKRVSCVFNKGKLFYSEYNIRLFFYLLFKRADCICAIDLDTILPCFLVSKLKGIKRVYDAHEYFSELNEIKSRPIIYKVWYWVESKMIPRFKKGYTVCQSIANEFNKKYKVDYDVIRNVPVLMELKETDRKEKIILYQGAVNIGRGLDKVVAAMQNIDAVLWVCGDGNFMKEMRSAVNEYHVTDKVVFWGMLKPEILRKKTDTAFIAINPFEKTGLNQYLSLPNKFFDYIHAALPQVTMNYPEYQHINQASEVAVLIDDLEPETIARSINKLFSDSDLYNKLRGNCLLARNKLNWQLEEKKLLTFYNDLFNGK
jgi:glycosyltransferase involved in cell wall biosynthesis